MKNILKAVGYVLFYIIFQIIVMSMTASIVGSSYGSKEQVELFMNNNMMFLTVISNILTITIFVVYFKILKRDLLKELNITKVGINEYILPCIITFSYSLAFSLLTMNANFENANIIQTTVEHYSSSIPYLGTILYVIALLIVAPVTEEFVYRGLVIRELQKKYNNVTVIIISALLFGVSHIIAGGVILSVGSLIVGVILGIICVKTRSLLPAIIAHIFANLPDSILSLLPNISVFSKYLTIIVCSLIFCGAMYRFIISNKD